MNKKLTTVLVLAIVLGTLLAPLPSQAQGNEGVLYVTVPSPAAVETLVAGGLDVWHVDVVNGQYLVTVWADPSDPRLAGYPVTVDEERTQVYRDAPNQVGVTGVTGQGFLGGYLTPSEMATHMQNLANAHPGEASVFDYGDSWDKATAGGPAGFDLQGIHIGPAGRHNLVVLCGVHAREIVPKEICRLFAEWLLSTEADAAYIRQLGVDILWDNNPDGSQIVATTGQLWRKNTRTNCGDASKRGTDLDRNRSGTWGGPGGSTDPCNETYRGAAATSEPESSGFESWLATYFTQVARNPRTQPFPSTTPTMILNLHAYGKQTLMVWGDNTQTPNHAQLLQICNRFGQLMGYACTFPYPSYAVSGTSDDHFYWNYGAAFTWEIGVDFFEPYSNLPTRWNETRPGLVQAAKLSPMPMSLIYGPEPTNVFVAPAMVNTNTIVSAFATVSDSQNGNQAIAEAQLFVDTPPEFGGTPIAMSATDGAFDETTEQVTGSFSTTGLPAGYHLVMVRARDAASNWGTISAAWLIRVEGEISSYYLPIVLKNNP